jgi:LEA14-like dessication related protein
MKKYIAFYLILLCSCKPIEPVEFKEIKNVRLSTLSDNQLKISADIILDNPNKIKITVTKLNLDILADEIPLVYINDDLSKSLEGKDESTLNITGDIDVKNLEKFLNQRGIALLLGSENPSLKFLGTIEAKAYGIKEVINIDFSLNNFSDLVR